MIFLRAKSDIDHTGKPVYRHQRTLTAMPRGRDSFLPLYTDLPKATHS